MTIRTFVAVLIVSSFALAQSATELPTIDQLKEQLNAGKTAEAMKGINRLVALKGPAAAAYDKYELYMLRGEADIRMKAMIPAAEAFAAAQKETNDDKKKLTARANEILARQSKPTGYVPRTPSTRATTRQAGAKPGAPLPIVDADSRKVAFGALFDDAMTQIHPKIAMAKNAKSLAPLVDVIKQLSDLKAIELAAEDSDQQAKQVGAELTTHAHELLADAVKSMSDRVDAIARNAAQQQMVTDPQTNMRVLQPVGPTYQEDKDLTSIVDTCQKIEQFAKDMADQGNQLQQDGTEARAVITRANAVPRPTITTGFGRGYNTGGYNTGQTTPGTITPPIVPVPRTR